MELAMGLTPEHVATLEQARDLDIQGLLTNLGPSVHTLLTVLLTVQKFSFFLPKADVAALASAIKVLQLIDGKLNPKS